MATSRFRFEQAGVIPYRRNAASGDLEWLLVTSRRGKRWVFPKGHIDDGLTPVEAGAMEAYEEAGVRGSTDGDRLGRYTYEKWGGSYRVTMFLMKVERVYEDWPEDHERDRHWMGTSHALDKVAGGKLRGLLRKAINRLDERALV